jgi:hypothetical protein
VLVQLGVGPAKGARGGAGREQPGQPAAQEGQRAAAWGTRMS